MFATYDQRWPHLFCHDLDAITAPLWGINPGGGRFYKESRVWIPTTTKLDRIKEAGATHVEAHDTDVLDLIIGEDAKDGYPVTMTEKKKMALLDQAVEQYQKELTQRSLLPGMWTMNLFNSEEAFVRGNLGSEITDTRKLSINRLKKGYEIAQDALKCILVYWNGTNGVDGVNGAWHQKRNDLTFQGFVTLFKWARRKYGDKAQPVTGEAKDEEPKHKMYTPVTQSFLAMSYRIAYNHPSLAGLLGVNPEVGHEVMAKLDAAMTFGEALFYGLLYHTHLNDQGGDPAFDRDHPFGSTCLRAAFDIIWQLLMGKYKGLLGIDAQPRPTDTDEQCAATIASSVKRIKWAVKKAREIDSTTLLALMASHDQHAIDEFIDTHVFNICL